MNKKSINRYTSILNIFCIFLISFFLITDFIIKKYEDFPNTTTVGSVLRTLLNVRILTLIVAISINIIINILCSIQNRKNKKLLITYLLIAFFEVSILIIDIFSLIDNYFDYVYIDDYIEKRMIQFIPIAICTIVAVIQLIFIHHQEDYNMQNNNKKKINIILNIISLIVLVISLISGVIFMVFYTIEGSEYSQYKENIKNDIKINFVPEAEERYFAVCENGKWGYINDDGRIVIPCIYDYATEFYEVGFTFKEEYLVGIVMKNNDYLLISPNNNSINLGNNPMKWYKNFYSSAIERIKRKVFLFCDEPVNNEQYVIEMQKSNDNEYTYTNENASIKITCNNELENLYTVTVKNANNELNTYEGEDLPLVDSEIYLYSDDCIPFYNKSENTQGWYDLDGNKHSLRGDWKILDVRNNIMIVRNDNEGKIYFFDLTANEYSFIAKEVMICTNGYIVKLLNENYIYIDNNLNLLTKEYSYIYSEETLKTNSIIDEIVNW